MTITTRAGKGSPLTFAEMDSNLNSFLQLDGSTTMTGNLLVSQPSAPSNSILLFSGTDITNCHFIRFRVDSGSVRLETNKSGTGTARNLDIVVNNGQSATFPTTGGLVINAPTSGDTLSLNVLAGGHNAWFATDGTVSTQWFLNGAAGVVMGNGSNHALGIRTNNTNRIDIAAAGNVTINAPSSGLPFTATWGTPDAMYMGGITTNVSSRMMLGFEGTSLAGVFYDRSTGDMGLAHSTTTAGTLTKNLIISAAGNVTINAPSSGRALTLNDTTLLATGVALTNGAAAAVGTLLNAPVAGNPTKWIPIVDNGTTRYIPCW